MEFDDSKGRHYNYRRLRQLHRKYLRSLIYEFSILKRFGPTQSLEHINSIFIPEFKIKITEALFTKEQTYVNKHIREFAQDFKFENGRLRQCGWKAAAGPVIEKGTVEPVLPEQNQPSNSDAVYLHTDKMHTY